MAANSNNGAKRADNAARRASDEATEWLVLLHEAQDDADTQRRFKTWLAENPLNESAWTATARLGGHIARVPPAHLPTWAHAALKVAAAKRFRIVSPLGWAPKWRFAAVLGVLAVLWLGSAVTPGLIVAVQADASTGTNEIRRIPLDDGSVVVLAPESAVALKYTKQERHVALLKGEAFFEVIHKDTHPFRVSTADIETIDLGTSFNIRRTADDVAISVQEGIVRVDRAEIAPITENLKAGEAIKVKWTGDFQRSAISESAVGAWRQGLIVAHDRPLGDVVAQLRPYFAGKILVMDEALKAQAVTGVYNLSDPGIALSLMVQPHGGQVRRVSPWLLVVSAN